MGQTNQVVTMYLERVGVIENDVKSTNKEVTGHECGC